MNKSIVKRYSMGLPTNAASLVKHVRLKRGQAGLFFRSTE